MKGNVTKNDIKAFSIAEQSFHMVQHSLSWVYYQKKMKTLNSKRYACPVSCSSIYCSQEMEAAQVSLHRWMGTEDGGCDCVYVCVYICIFSSVCAHMGTHTH